MDLSFDERLNSVLKDRKQTPWGKGLGFTGASISHIFSGGRVPGPEFLSAIRRAENVNLNWLLTGEGQPYIVNYHQTAQSLTETVQAMIEDEPWIVYVCAHQQHAALVLTQPGQYEFKGKWIDYTMVHVLVGPGDEALHKVLTNYNSNGGSVLIPMLTELQRQHIVEGKTGTYELFGGLGPLLNPVAVASHISQIEFGSPDRTTAPVSLSLMRAVVSLVEDCADELGENLTSEQKSRVITAVYRQAERLGLTSDDLTPDSIRTAIDVIRD